ncbi:MAG: SusD family protein [Mucilaginibacter sp.]|nr:SusD family protein [Mucilaginibacter sp.]
MKRFYILLIFLAICGTACKKFLDAKPDQSLALPKDNLGNLQLLLNDTYTMNQRSPAVAEIATDNVYLSDQQWTKLKQTSATSANPYIFSKDIFNETNTNDWTTAYNVVFNANLVLDAIKQIPVTSSTLTQWNSIKGSALFFRAVSFYSLLQEFAKGYNQGDPASNPGIVLRLTSDINTKSVRASVAASYNQVITDLQQAVPLLPVSVAFKTNPTKAAALGLLARTYLVMGNYAQALNYANQYLVLSPALLDFNTLDTTASYPISRYNNEVTFHETLYAIAAYRSAYVRVADTLFNAYDPNDLRKTLFFNNGGVHNIKFKGSYDGSQALFSGVATDEVYLVAAECYARSGDLKNGLLMLNTLLTTRWVTGTFVPFDLTDQNSLMQLILAERRKELLFRNIRWSDLKRLNQETAYQTTIKRMVNGQTYQLLPGDNYYTLPIPIKVVQESNVTQN